MKYFRLRKGDDIRTGFTLIELLVVLVVIGILITLVATTYSGVQAKNRNGQREADINTIQGELEGYYAQNSKYPTLDNLNNPSWLSKNIKDFPVNTLQDPHWSEKTTACTENSRSIVIGKVAKNCYSYQVISIDGSVCDNVKVTCAHYTLTALLEGGTKYVKSSLN